MIFDFDRFAKAVKMVYHDGTPYTLEEVIWVFRTYFQAYEDNMGAAHPVIKVGQIKRIMEKMPCIDCCIGDGTEEIDIEAICYEDLIAQHFLTDYMDCDYNINHFFSGRIRELRYFETLY